MISRKLQFVIATLVIAIFAMGAYLVHLKGRAESMGTPPVSQSLTAPVSGPAEQMVLYIATDADNSLRATDISSPLPTDPGERGRLCPAHPHRPLSPKGFASPARSRSRRA